MIRAANTRKIGSVPPPHILRNAKVRVTPSPPFCCHLSHSFQCFLSSAVWNSLKSNTSLLLRGDKTLASQQWGDIQELKEGQKGKLPCDLSILRIFLATTRMWLNTEKGKMNKKEHK